MEVYGTIAIGKAGLMSTFSDLIFETWKLHSTSSGPRSSVTSFKYYSIHEVHKNDKAAYDLQCNGSSLVFQCVASIGFLVRSRPCSSCLASKL